LIVLGGPSVPNDPADFFDSHPGIDLLCHGEGEESFAEILEAMLAGRAPSRIAGTTHYERGTGQVTANPPRQRFRDLTPIPSPYLGGIFDGLLAGRPDVEWMALWETNRGCPFSCSFCEWGGADTTKLRRFDMDRLGAEIDWFARHEIGWIFCCDANFGILKRDLEIAQLLTRAKRARGYPQEFRVCYTKNSSGRIIELAKLFDQAEMGKGVSISMQSLNPDTLKRIKRVNMAASDFATLQGKFAAQGLVTFTEMIVALPGETYDSFAAGLETLLDCGQHGGINIYNCSILPNSEMAEPEYQKAHGIQTVDIPVFQPHSSPPEAGAEVIEGERIAVATDSLPIEDWRRVQRFAWAVQCFHLLGMLQAVALTLKNAMGVGYRDFYESLIAHGLDNPRGLVGGELARLDAVLVNVLAGKGFDQYLEGFLDVT
ncbi:MAG: radical SAM protein, partial [Rhodospirillales bacterium]|nr:radical SAM protein [Rhodospirillales bacterium]